MAPHGPPWPFPRAGLALSATPLGDGNATDRGIAPPSPAALPAGSAVWAKMGPGGPAAAARRTRRALLLGKGIQMPVDRRTFVKGALGASGAVLLGGVG